MKKRFLEIDFLRGLAVILMVIFHFLFTLWFLEVFKINLFDGEFLVLARTVQFIFLGLVGVSLALSSQKTEVDNGRYQSFLLKQIKRGVVILGCGFLITIGSLVFVPEWFVKWGVLHTIGLGIIFYSLFIRNIWWLIGLVIFFAFSRPFLVDLFVGESSYPLYALGATPWGGGSLDYFPIFPWFSIIGIGGILGHLLYKNFDHRFKFLDYFNDYLKNASGFVSRGVIWCGRNALKIYMLHIPLLGLIKFLV